MPRPNRSRERRVEYLPAIAQTFAELGYRRATTAELARRLSVQENSLFRLWGDKRSMFLAAIQHVYESTQQGWAELLELKDPSSASAAEKILAYEAKYHGQAKLYRIVFAGLNETDDPKIHTALRTMFRNFHRFIAEQIKAYRGDNDEAVSAEQAAWGIVGLGLMSDVAQELHLLTGGELEAMFWGVGKRVLTAE